MSRLCCVNQCGVKSGSRKTLFQISNSDLESYNTVLNALGSHLRQSKCLPKNLFICELHFAEESITRTNINVMADGSELVLPRKRPRLKRNSVPTIFPDQIQNKTKKPMAAINNNKFSRTKKNKMDLMCGEEKNVEDECVLPTRNVKLEPPETNKMAANPVIEQKNNYNQKQLIEDWRALCKGSKPSHWTMGDSSHGVLFVYFGDDPTSPTRSVLVKEDMSLEIRHHARLANLSTLKELRNFQDFCEVIKTVTYSRICEGVHNIPCLNVFFVSKLRSKSTKCTDCRKINKRIKDVTRNRQKRAQLKGYRRQQLLTNLKKKYRRATDKKTKVEEYPVDPLSLPEIKHEEDGIINDLSSEANEISLLCRLCAQFSNQNTPITSEIIVMIKSILSIDDDVNFPQFLCSDCNDNLIRSYQFQQNSLHAVQKLRTIINADLPTIVDVRSLIKDEPTPIEKETICLPSDAKKPRFENPPINDDSNLTELILPKKHIESQKTKFEYLCKVCNLKFQDYNVYKDHVKTHDSAPKFQYICKHCPAVFTDFNMYKNHTNEEHTSNMGKQISRELQCNSCTRRFCSIAELKTHAKIHLNEILQCNKCSKKFLTLVALKQHQLRNHNC